MKLAFFVLLLLAVHTQLFAQSAPKVSITKSGCQGASVLILDELTVDQGLSVVEVLYDSEGLYTTNKLVSYNVTFDGPEPPDYYSNTADSFKIKVIDPTRDAYLAVYAANHLGRSTVAEWRHKAIGMQMTGDGAFTNDTVGATTCSSFKIINHDTTILFGGITSPSRSGFTVSNISSPAGSSLKNGDSVTFQICFESRTIDTLFDTLAASVGCNSIPIPLMGTGLAPIIDAEDVTFNGVDLTDTACKLVRVWNRGSSPLILSGKSTSTEIILAAAFPDTIPPHSFEVYDVCVAPKGAYGARTADIVWSTNEPSAYAHGYKDTTHVGANASPAGLHWDRLVAYYDPAHDTTLELNVLTFQITNTAHLTEVIDSIVINGPQAETFVSYQMQFPRGVGLAPDQSMNVAIQWRPDVPPPDIQTAKAYIFSAGVATDSLFLFGIFPSLSVSNDVVESHFKIFPNPVTGNSLHVWVADPSEASIEVLNVLGNVVTSTPIAQAEGEITLPQLAGGTYFVRMTQHGVTQTKRIAIER
jgi:hypothetical protein